MGSPHRLVLTALALGLTVSCGDDDAAPRPPAMAGAGGVDDGEAGAPTSPAAGSNAGGSAGQAGGPVGGETGSAGDAGHGGDAGAGGDGSTEPPIDCGSLVPAPAKFDVLDGFTSSEDFAFDELGNYVGIDADGNLVRVTKAGKKTLWAPSMGQTAGMGMLPDGSVAIADVSNGAVKRVFPNGASQVVLGGLLYPNGLDIGPDGYIYVAENNAGRVRRIDPDTGDFSIVAMGLFGPNGVAFSSDPKLMYVGSFEGSGVYRVEIPGPGMLGTARVLARPDGSQLPEPKLACPAQQVGEACTTPVTEMPGKCQKLANVVDCVPDNPCAGAEEGAKCAVEGREGTCESGTCVIADDCATKQDGDECRDDWGDTGICQLGFCAVEDPCTGKPDGTECKVFGVVGLCGGGFCTLSGPCTGKQAGDACFDGLSNGTCHDDGGALWCRVPDPCGDNPDECESPGGIDGLGVDACGFVYASEFQRGFVWRISPSGELEKLVTLPSAWIPNIKWGRGLGGFERDVMYVADRDEGRLFAIAVGRPGAVEYYDLAVKP